MDDQAGQIVRYVRENLDGHLDCAYGLSLGGKILSRVLDECRKAWPSGGGKAVRDGYKDVYPNKLESIHGDDIHFWYGSKEAFVAKPQAKYLLTLCPGAHIEVFPKMNHGQLLIDHPDEVARRIKSIALPSQPYPSG